MTHLSFICLVSVSLQFGCAAGAIEFTQTPPGDIEVTNGSRIPPLVWRYSEAGENVSVSVIFYSSFPPWPQKLWAQKRFANPWNVTNPAVNMTDQATLIVKDAATRKFEGQITLELETSLGIQRRSTVSLSVIVFVAFTEEPPKRIEVVAGSRIPDMVWKVNATNKDVELEVKLEPLGVKKIEVAEQELNEAWESKYPRVFVKDQATLVFKETAQKSDQGNYTMAIRRSKMPKIKSTVELIILDRTTGQSTVETGVGFTATIIASIMTVMISV